MKGAFSFFHHLARRPRDAEEHISIMWIVTVDGQVSTDNSEVFPSYLLIQGLHTTAQIIRALLLSQLSTS